MSDPYGTIGIYRKGGSMSFLENENQMVEATASLLQERLSDKDKSAGKNIVISGELIVRKSVKIIQEKPDQKVLAKSTPKPKIKT